MTNILDEIINNPTDTEDYVILDELKSIYTTGYRHSYYELSTYIGKLSLDESDMLETKLFSLLEVCDDNPNYDEIKNSLQKLVDHVSLEGLRLSRLKEMEYKTIKATKNVDVISQRCKDEIKEIDALKQSVNNIHKDTIGILGIFAGLVIGFMASFQLLADSLNAINEISFFKGIAFFCVIGTIMFDCIFLLIFSVARISGRSLALRCKRCECNDCKKCNHSITIIHKKYPYVIWYNAIMLLVFIVCVVLNTFVVI